MAAIKLRGDALTEELGKLGARTNVDKASVLGLNDGTVSRVLSGVAAPGNRFIAAVLSNVPRAFDELFELVDDGQALAGSSKADG